MKSIISLILITAAVVLFIFFTKPKIAALKETQLEVDKLNIARDNAKNLETRINQLLDIKKNIPAKDLEKLGKMLPNNVENVKLIIDFDKMLQAMVEERDTLKLYKSTETTETGSKKISIENPKVTPGGLIETNYDSSKLGVVTFAFTVALTYEDFLEFLRRIEHSTRLLDVDSVTFTASADASSKDKDQVSGTVEVPIYNFNVSLRTYWLKYINENTTTQK